MKAITPRELLQKTRQNSGLAVLDVRTPGEFAEVHAPGAVNEPLGGLNPDALGFPQDQPVYLLCQTGGRAAKAAALLERAGYAQPVVVTGGTQAWIDAGLPVERGGASGAISLERQVRITAGALVLAGVLLARFVHPHFIWLSGFVGAGLVFAGLTNFCGMGLLLARMPWNRKR